MSSTGVRIRPDLEEQLEVLSNKLDEKHWQETLPALESIKEGRVVSADKVLEWMRSWGSDNELLRPK
jgi:predicted transcriptional regulator